jgi:NAD-reducing hydrogenase small subunit
MAANVTVASDWLAGCAGCHMSLLDMDEKLVWLLEHVTLTSTPVTDLKHPPKEGVTVGILEGCVNNSANEEVAKEMRKRCKVLVALGDCAVFGGVPTMRNCARKEQCLRRAYMESETTYDGEIPNDPVLATMEEARALNQVVDVDVCVPGCPPPADAIHYVLSELAQGRMPKLTGKYLDWH